MLTDQDIQKIVEANKQVFATKEELKGFATKQDLMVIKEDIKDIKNDVGGIRESIQSLILSVDKFVKTTEDLSQEAVSATLRMERQEKWIHQIAEKIGVQLKY